jgi:PEP-CTERM motif
MKYIKLFCLMTMIVVGARGQVLTGWGSSDFTLAFNDGAFSQDGGSATWSGSELGMILRGTFTPVALADTPSGLDLALTFSTTYSGQIDITIGSSAGNVLGYSSSVTGASGSSILSFVRSASLDAGSVVLGSVNRVAITATSPNFVLNTLTATSAIPEPSTYAAVAGLAILGVAATRRRRA